MSDVRTNSSSYNNTRQQGRLTDPIDSMDGNNKTAGLQHCEVRSSEDPMLSLNGEVSLTNGYSSKAAADNDGSGSESGYTTPRKRRARRSSMKGAENVSRDKERSLQRGIMSYSKQDLETSGQEAAEKMVNSRPNCTRTCLKTEVHTGVRRAGIQEMTPMDEVQCKNSDGRPSGPISKKTDDKVSKTKLTSSVTSKEDLWTLFKPPPVFPVDNSSAKIVPKISYASKVKENLNKAAQASAEEDLAQASVKLSQVPMSAVKMVTSASFTNGPVSEEPNGCPSEGALFNSAASTAPSASNPGEENVASNLDTSCSSSYCPSVPEPRKSSLFVYPHKPLNMQTVLPSARHMDTPAAQTNQKALGDIFHNQWGLSFINEPNAGPEGTSSSRPTGSVIEVGDITFQGGSLPFFLQPGLDPACAVFLPPPQEVEKRTSGTDADLKACSPSRTASEDCPQAQPVSQEERRVENSSPAVSCKDLDTERAVTPVVSVGGPPKVQNSVKCDNWTNSWDSFDLRAAVYYHTKEFEHLVTLRKHDPKRVVYYEEAMDGPDH
ncbi:nuclear fragile X mental retardation-interacting protein 2 [Astyanax mexicanus]|uniref:nuclear fragile X mental retardation-interacting protein 2 n=1 Tax=Astyanax mexicanus TaxID=7994 RepID=UPI0020CAA4AE|nr:nuclear fragile X mental retardation-interacting protein 2 [Astyanax mexicanus]